MSVYDIQNEIMNKKVREKNKENKWTLFQIQIHGSVTSRIFWNLFAEWASYYFFSYYFDAESGLNFSFFRFVIEECLSFLSNLSITFFLVDLNPCLTSDDV